MRAKIRGSEACPRFSIFRSNQNICVQIIDDDKGETLISASSLEIPEKIKPKIKQAEQVGILIAEKAKKKGIKKVVFDRSYYKYHGRIKAVVESFVKGLEENNGEKNRKKRT